MDFDAIVLAGGGSTRFGGVDKAMLVLDGVTLLDRVLEATKNARTTVVVGPPRPTARPVEWTTEQPPAGGPVAGIAAGLAYGEALIVVIVSCDLPRLTDADVTALTQNLTADGHGLRDSDGREQYLAAAYRRTALQRALDDLGDPRDKSVRRLVAPLDLTWTTPQRSGDDVDTWSDLDD